MTFRPLAAAVALLVCCLPPSAVAQEQPTPTFRSGTRLIVTPVTVTDANGRAVEGLTADDFHVTEDGVAQSIAFVDFQRIDPSAASPVPAAQPSVAAGDLATTASSAIVVPAGGYPDRRLVVLYFDMSAMPIQDQMRAYTHARTFVGTQMQPVDMFAVMSFQSGAVQVLQSFTGDRAALIAALDMLVYGRDLDQDGIREAASASTAFGQGDLEFSIFNTDRQLSALQTAVTMLRPLAEQKSLVYFASGIRLNGTDNSAQLRATINAALRSNVAIFPVDARGLEARPPIGDATQASPGGEGIFSGQQAQTTNAAWQRSQDTLFALAAETGGKAWLDHNDLSLGIRQAADAISSYYLIAYHPANLTADGRFRWVEVILKKHAKTKLAYRRGYFAEKSFARFTRADRERQLEEALMLENPVTEIPLAMEVNYFQLNQAEYFVPVAVKIPGSELEPVRRRGSARTTIDVIGEVKDEYGTTIQNVRDRLDINLSDEVIRQLATRPMHYETGFTLLPGRYVIKLLARESTTGRIGTYQTEFVIPNLNREEVRIPISSVVLASQRVPVGGALHTVRQDPAVDRANPLVQDGHKLLPSVTRVFSRQRDLHVLLHVYPRDMRSSATYVVYVSFYQDSSKVFESGPSIVSGDAAAGKLQAVPLVMRVPLDALRPGAHAFQVTVLDLEHQKAAFWTASIAVVP